MISGQSALQDKEKTASEKVKVNIKKYKCKYQKYKYKEIYSVTSMIVILMQGENLR